MIMHRSPTLRATNVLAILVLIASCSSNRTPAVDTDATEFFGAPPQEMNWAPEPEGEGILTAVLVGNPDDHGALVARYDIPPNMEIGAHTHREVRSYTVISGIWELGFGEEFNSRKLEVYPQGGYYRLPAGVPHFQRAGPDGAIIQIESIGPDTFDPIE
jgi:quercetin dioxygenase-like cupin family protein